MDNSKRARIASQPDPLTRDQRRFNMSRIRAMDTAPELLVRRAMHARGLRYRVHDRTLPGTPDIVLRGPKSVIFVHGCFWHGHDCPKGVTPGTNTEFWTEKITRNRVRDDAVQSSLYTLGWRVIVIWECALRGKARRDLDETINSIQDWIVDSGQFKEIEGNWL